MMALKCGVSAPWRSVICSPRSSQTAIKPFEKTKTSRAIGSLIGIHHGAGLCGVALELAEALRLQLLAEQGDARAARSPGVSPVYRVACGTKSVGYPPSFGKMGVVAFFGPAAGFAGFGYTRATNGLCRRWRWRQVGHPQGGGEREAGLTAVTRAPGARPGQKAGAAHGAGTRRSTRSVCGDCCRRRCAAR